MESAAAAASALQSLAYRKRPQIAVVAVARELVGFLWAVMQDVADAGAQRRLTCTRDRGPACGVEARGASTLDGVMRPASDQQQRDPRA